jgi:Leucine-rich repeat (LRR) protein
MSTEIKKIHQKITEILTSDYLKNQSAKLITAYRQKDKKTVFHFASRVLSENISKLSIDQIFIHSIKKFHPDRYKLMIQDVDDAVHTNDLDRLKFYAKLIELPGYFKPQSNYFKKTDFLYEEVYAFKEADPQHFYDDISDSVSFEENSDYSYSAKEDYTFEEAVHDLYLGNQPREEIYIEPDDFLDFDELLLAESEISILKGLQFCKNLTILDLSNNEITDIDEISSCTKLTILDLSHNDITEIKYLKPLKDLISLNLSKNSIDSIDALEGHETLIDLDISNNYVDDLKPLLMIKNLQTINIAGNPNIDASVISELQKKGILILN